VSTHSTTPREEFLAGVRAQLPILLGVAPFGMIFGALALTAGIPPLQTQGFSLFIFAGSAQFIAAGLVGDGAPPLVIVITIFVVNLRHMLYSANLAAHFERLTRPWKVVLAWLLTDEAFAVASLRYRRQDTTSAHWYTLGTGLTLWGAWQVSTALGILVGAGIPTTWSLDFALPLTFLALLAPMLTDRPTWFAALTGGLIAVLLNGLPYKLGLLLGSGFGVVIGLAADLAQNSRGQEPV
jgi:4-azaleucine resistance transporter AzlC